MVIHPASAAGVIVDSNGFESPGFVAGALQGQQGWFASGGVATTATVQSSVVQSGSQAVQVNRGAATDGRFAHPVTGFPTQRFVIVDWDMRVTQSISGGFGPYFGVEAYDDHDEPFAQLIGSFGVDATTGDVLYQAQTSGALTATGTSAIFNQWQHYRLLLDFSLNRYHVFLDGAQLRMEGFVDAGADEFTDADISALAASFDANSQNATGTAYFDNFLVRDGMLGDYDIDGDVDAADYGAWRQAFGTTVGVPGNGADGNRNGIVDAGDYVIWRKNNGKSLFTGGGSAGVAGVAPEPASLLLLLIGSAALSQFWRRHR